MSLTLTIVIPALNEEDAIGPTIERCLAARGQICDQGGVDTVEIVVVNDGSTDGTSEIAHRYEEIEVVDFEVNQGYGAAIKAGWSHGSGELLGFLDADGTCDPVHFSRMCQVLLDERADMVLGSRMGHGSEMPRVRRIGNRMFAFVLGFLSGEHITDTASGMRVIRRECLPSLQPLPSGLQFTPALSAKALFNRLKVIEIPMSYRERVGQSKLRALRDGVRFLRAILDSVLCYRPELLFQLVFVVCLLSLLLLAANPAEFYLQNRKLEEWMIYRFVACSLLGWFGYLMLLATSLVNQMARFSPRHAAANTFWPSLIGSVLRGPMLVGITAGLLLLAGGFLWPGIVEYASTTGTHLHWSRLLAGAFCLFSSVLTIVFLILQKVVALWISWAQTWPALSSAEERPAHARSTSKEPEHPVVA